MKIENFHIVFSHHAYAHHKMRSLLIVLDLPVVYNTLYSRIVNCRLTDSVLKSNKTGGRRIATTHLCAAQSSSSDEHPAQNREYHQ